MHLFHHILGWIYVVVAKIFGLGFVCSWLCCYATNKSTNPNPLSCEAAIKSRRLEFSGSLLLKKMKNAFIVFVSVSVVYNVVIESIESSTWRCRFHLDLFQHILCMFLQLESQMGNGIY